MTTFGTYQPPPSPEAPYLTSPIAFVQPRHKDRGSFVQRWKIVRERNRSLPKLDFNSQANGSLKPSSQSVALRLTRSITTDGAKLPQIASLSTTTTSVDTTDTSLKADSPNSRQNSEGSLNKKNISIQDSTEDKDREKGSLPKALLAELGVNQNQTKMAGYKKIPHRYQTISHQKKLSDRNAVKEKRKSEKETKTK